MSETKEKPSLITREEVMFFDTDCAGVVHNLAYLRMVEVNRTKLAALMGMNLKEMGDSGVYPVIVRTEADYIRPGKLGDVLRIEGKLGEVGRSSFKMDFEMYRDSDNDLLLRVCQTLALVQVPPGKPCRIPREWREQWA